jgi:hypothetical protein
MLFQQIDVRCFQLSAAVFEVLQQMHLPYRRRVVSWRNVNDRWLLFGNSAGFRLLGRVVVHLV